MYHIYIYIKTSAVNLFAREYHVRVSRTPYQIAICNQRIARPTSSQPPRLLCDISRSSPRKTTFPLATSSKSKSKASTAAAVNSTNAASLLRQSLAPHKRARWNMKGTNITQHTKKVPADMVTKNTVKEANTVALQIVIVDFRELIRHTHIGYLPTPNRPRRIQ